MYTIIIMCLEAERKFNELLATKSERLPGCVAEFIEQLRTDRQLGSVLVNAIHLNGAAAQKFQEGDGARYFAGVMKVWANVVDLAMEATYGLTAIWILYKIGFVDTDRRIQEIKAYAALMERFGQPVDGLLVPVRNRFDPPKDGYNKLGIS
jgi:hypothetical protein